MSDLSPLNSVPLPTEFEEPYYQTGRNRDLAWDTGTFANAENSQLQFMSEGVVGWDADGASLTTGILYWADHIYVSAYTNQWRAKIEGPGTIEIQDGEVVFFQMPRQMTQDTVVQLQRGSRIFSSGVRLWDLRLVAKRVGSVLYFYNGKSLADGDLGLIFGGGLGTVSIYPPHEHMVPVVIEPPPGTTMLDAQLTAADGLWRVYLYRNGQLRDDPNDYSIVLSTGIITLVLPSSPGDRYTILRERRDTSHTTSTHAHLTPLVVNPAPGTVLLDMLVTAPIFQGVDIFRNGFLQSEPGDYTMDPNTGFATLVLPSSLGDRYVSLRRINI